MRYDLIAPDALLAALREASDDHHLIGEMIGSGGEAALETLSGTPLLGLAQNAAGPTRGELLAIAHDEAKGEAQNEQNGDSSALSGDALAVGKKPSGLQFTFDGVQSVAAPAKMAAAQQMSDDQRYAIMIDAAMSAVRKATGATLGELDSSILQDTTGMPREASGIAAQLALNEFNDNAEHPRGWSADEFASELNLRGFSAQVAQSHASAINALLDEDAETPDDLTAAVEIHIDPVSKEMDSASLYLGRRDAHKIATAEIRWIEHRGRPTPEARIQVSYLH